MRHFFPALVVLTACTLPMPSLAMPSFAIPSLAIPSLARQAAGDSQAPSAAPARNSAASITKAEDLLEHGNYPAAEVELKALAAADPSNAQLQFDLGFTEEHNEESAAAAISYAAAITADPSMPEARVALGLLEARLGHAEAALPPLLAAADMTTASPQLRGRALRALARLQEVSNPAQAVADLLRATQLTGEEPGDADLSASLAAKTGTPTDAEAAYRRALAADAGNLEAIAGLAGTLDREGKLAEADALLRPAVAAHPEDAQLAARLAALDAAENKPTEAIALLEALRSRDTQAASDPALTRLLAHLELTSGNAAAAEPLYASLVASAPRDPLLLDDLGSTLVREAKFAEAQTILTRAVALRVAFHDDAAWGEAAGHLAFAASRNHDPRGALQALQLRATVLPNSPASLFLQATANDSLQRKREAITSYRAFLAAANGKLPDEEFEARHRLVTLEHEH